MEGLLVAHVDDFLWAGTVKFFTCIINKLKGIFKISTEKSENFKYLGVELKQTEKGIYADLINYSNSIQELKISNERSKEKNSPLTENETDDLRSIIGKLNWLSTRTRPDLAYGVCELSTKLKTGTVELLHKANKLIKQAKHNQIFLHFPKLDLDTVAVRCYADASFANLPDGGSQGGLFVELFSGNDTAPIEWRSKRLSRTPRSTLSAETISMVDAMESCILIGKLMSEILHNSDVAIPVEGVTDNYSLFEVAHSTTSATEKRLRIEIAILREAILQKNFELKWCNTAHQLADSLTKDGSDPRKLLEHITGKIVV